MATLSNFFKTKPIFFLSTSVDYEFEFNPVQSCAQMATARSIGNSRRGLQLKWCTKMLKENVNGNFRRKFKKLLSINLAWPNKNLRNPLLVGGEVRIVEMEFSIKWFSLKICMKYGAKTKKKLNRKMWFGEKPANRKNFYFILWIFFSHIRINWIRVIG